VPETQYLDAVIRRKRGELKIAAKMKSKRVDSKDLRKRVNLKTCLSERDRLYDENSSAMQGMNKRMKRRSKKAKRKGKITALLLHRCQSN